MRDYPPIQCVKASDARQRFSQLLNQVYRKETRVVVEKSGIPVAAIVSADDLRALQQLDEQRERGFAAIERISQAFADVPVDELERQVVEAIAQVRAENRQQKLPSSHTERKHCAPTISPENRRYLWR